MKEMKSKTVLFIAIATIFIAFQSHSPEKFSKKDGFNMEKDFLLAQFDCKTDVDDIHTMAALATLLSDSCFSTVNYHAVTGTYGIQKGL
jgi:hypothetical protein